VKEPWLWKTTAGCVNLFFIYKTGRGSTVGQGNVCISRVPCWLLAVSSPARNSYSSRA
jgi:hypothetical protein